MVKMGHRVVVAGFYSPGYGGSDEFDDEGVKVYRYRWRMDGVLKNEQKLSTRIIKKLLTISGILDRDIKKSLVLYQSSLENIIARHEIDIIEMPDYNDYVRHCRSFIPFPKLSVPVVIKMNGSITYFNREAGKPVPDHIFKIERGIINRSAGVAAVSQYTASKSAEYFIYTDKIDIIPNGINTAISFDGINKNPLQVIFTGTLVQKKGIYQLAKAWNMVNRQVPGARLLVLGKGNCQKVMNLLNPDAQTTVSFMGHVAAGELYRYLSSSAIAVFPSYAEAFALAPLEAMACGIAVINSNRTSGPELIDNGIDGLLIDPDDIDQLASAILHLLNNVEIREQIAKAGNKKVGEVFDIANIAQQNTDFYNRVLIAK
ncbi:glycosyltransferase family 4 protein [Mucilaginibacter mali]|uniref:Glycosyltransferase family 4 protein n=1 Tax=Mucilaginibacter mali TaxID=2740462 RepID=A0A7D4QS79_9SPHI|nr:glycosyltransferase family 4 protein [Mucilaginibacter mali]QKJ29929.1 glycosyltransferase family 4 protein [Mucilaginibacter mali]